MTRYIDTEIIAKIVFDYWKECERIERIIPAIKRAIIYHSTADVVEVVRCKECKHWDEEFGECDHPKVGRRVQVPAGFYCGWGERRTDDAEIH